MTDSKITSLPDTKRVEEEAAVWIMRLQDGDASESVRTEFSAWQAQSIRHRDAFEELSRFWDGLEVVEQLKDYAQNDAATQPVQLDRSAGWAQRARQSALAATFVLAAAITFYRLAIPSNETFSGAYQTAVGEQQTIALPDGSQILLNTDSALMVAFSGKRRDVLLSKGEAYFDVAPNPKKPFSVNTHKGTVTAVGTAFSVRLRDEKLNVLVTEGRVALAEAPAASAHRVAQAGPAKVFEVSAGQSAVMDHGVEAISIVMSAAMEKAVDWRDGVLSFKGETLEQVIADIARYTNMKIEIGDEELRSQKIVAYYKVGDIERMFDALRVMADVKVQQIGENHVRLYRDRGGREGSP